jgi:4-diphosphocytidyl-2-C-methyl-D-erythritol kinase
MYVRKLGKSVLIDTPAKLNLSLEVLSRRSDGFHEIETLIVAVSICDTLVFTPADSPEISLACRWAGGLAAQAAGGRGDSLGDVPQGEDNIVWRALDRLRTRADVRRGGDVQLTKRILSASGLGGASSDAAAALVAANLGWQLGWPRERLAEVAAEIGSDVPFFLTRGAAICRGRGELIEPIEPARLCVVVVRPPVGLNTPEVYRRCQPAASPIGSDALTAALRRGQVAAAGRMLNNRLEEPATQMTPWIGRLRQELSRLDVLGHQMSGSGSSYFGICRHARHARRVAARLRSRGVGMVFAAATAVTPN